MMVGTLNRVAIRCLAACTLMLVSTSAFAYIDPGVTYALLQWLSVLIFGAATAFIVRPWLWIKAFFKKTPEKINSDDGTDNQVGTQKDTSKGD